MEQGAKDFLRGGLYGHSVAGHCRVPHVGWQWRPDGLLPSAAVPGYGFSAGAGCADPRHDCRPHGISRYFSLRSLRSASVASRMEIAKPPPRAISTSSSVRCPTFPVRMTYACGLVW